MKKIIKTTLKILLVIIVLFTIFVIVIRKSSTVKIFIDNSGLKDISEMVLKYSNSDSKSELEKYISSFNILPDKCERKINITPLKKWRLNDKKIIQKRLEFTSCDNKDKAIFYLYRKRNTHPVTSCHPSKEGNSINSVDKQDCSLSGQNVILWIPGFAVSDKAFYFIKKFFTSELDKGYAVLFYNIPFHLDRIAEGKKMGEGLFNLKITDNFKVIKNSLNEINTMINYLKSKGMTSISGWGGSIGGAILWLSSVNIKYEHLALMIPIVNWNTVIFNKHLSEITKKLNQNGLVNETIKKSYQKLNPVNYKSLTNPEKIFLMYAKYDQLTPEKQMNDFAKKYNITNIKSYNESHATILLETDVYKDYDKFLNNLK